MMKTIKPRIGSQTPGGRVEQSFRIIKGVYGVFTENAFAIKLSAERLATMPDYLRTPDGWYPNETHVVPLVVWPKEFEKIPALESTMRRKQHIRDFRRIWPYEARRFCAHMTK